MRARLRLSEVENASKEGGDSVYEESRVGREDLRGRRGRRDRKRVEQTFFSPPSTALYRELAVELVYLTFVWHFPSMPLLLHTAPWSRPLYASLPLKSTQNLCSNLHFPTHSHSHLLSSNHKYSINLTYSVWNDIYILFWGGSCNIPQTIVENSIWWVDKHMERGVLLLLHEALRRPRGYSSVLGRQHSFLM